MVEWIASRNKLEDTDARAPQSRKETPSKIPAKNDFAEGPTVPRRPCVRIIGQWDTSKVVCS